MFFALSKILGFFTFPSTLLVSAGLFGVALSLTRWRRIGAALTASALIGIVVLGLLPVSILMMSPLVERFPAWQSDGRDPDGVIVLGGAINATISASRASVEMSSAAERAVAMLELAARFPKARIVFSGGSGNLVVGELPEAPAAKALLESFQFRGDRFIFEDGARTTFENATHTKALVSPKPGERWLLVTSAYHMPRSIGAFRQVGFDVVAYPVDWQIERAGELKTFSKVSDGLAMTDTAVHEWVGLFVYWITGKSSALLPKP